MTHLVNDLLLLTRFDERRLVEPEPVELVGLTAEAIETARTVAPNWPIGFVAGEPVEILADRVALRQVVDNLLSNVRAHTPLGTRTIVSINRIEHHAVIEIADEGPGLTEEQTTMVFERFFRADPSRSRQTGGAGLGLAIVASIVQAHGGEVTASSPPGGGTVFCVSIPALEPASSESE